MSRESLPPASCSAMIAPAAVTPLAAEPCEKSRLPLVSLSSSILPSRMRTSTASGPRTSICRMLSCGELPP